MGAVSDLGDSQSRYMVPSGGIGEREGEIMVGLGKNGMGEL